MKRNRPWSFLILTCAFVPVISPFNLTASTGMSGCPCAGCESRRFSDLKYCAVCVPEIKHPEMKMDMSGMDMAGMDMNSGSMGGASHSMMSGFYGDYSMARDGSGTSWQPDSTPVDGIERMQGDWMMMFDGFATSVYDHQGGPRGADDVFSGNMFMVMADHPLAGGKIGLRSMFSADPLTMGRDGYPLLLQTGETANGRTPLIDRQHPHDLLMELALTYSHPISDSTSVFAYFGLPGEPALGPPVYMHRFSGEEIPVAPITHHWLDSTHVTFGVATIGVIHGKFKLESSVFTGREPDEFRYNFDTPRFDSYSFRLSYNPVPNWSLQTSFGHLHSPEQLEPEVNQNRWTASAIYNRAWNGNEWQTTMAWGRDLNTPGHGLNGYLLESTVAFDRRHTVMARVERVGKDDLFETGGPLANRIFTVGEASLGYIYDFYERPHFETGLGAMAMLSFVPAALQPAYGAMPVSEIIFLQMRLK